MIIAFCIDENMIQHLLVCIHSIISTNPDQPLQVYVLNKDITNQSKTLINENLNGLPVNLQFVEVVAEQYADLMISNHITIEAYFRISLADLLPAHITRVIYLDCDIIIMGSLKYLWELDLKGHLIGAVAEYKNNRNIEMGLGADNKVFNSGVLVIDLVAWRKEDISRQVFGYLKSHPEKIKFHDQDALNAVLLRKWLPLPIKYNYTVPYSKLAGLPDHPLAAQLNEPVVMHFNQSFKPWHYQSRHPFKPLYYNYLRLTPFNDFVPKDYNLINIIRKSLAKVLIAMKLKAN